MTQEYKRPATKCQAAQREATETEKKGGGGLGKGNPQGSKFYPSDTGVCVYARVHDTRT